ncbi:hypothetical protein BH18CHL2_BH18CHL2_12870 [soil metagenome]
MKGHDALLALGGVALALGIAAVLVAGATGAPPRTERIARFFVGPPAVASGLPLERRGGVIAAARASQVTNLPLVAPVQRGIAEAARDAAAYVLVLLGVAGSLLLAREPVLACYRATLGGWRSQLRVLASGLALLALLASSAFLAFVVLVGTVAESPLPRAGLGLQSLLQGGLVVFSVGFVFVGLVALVGLAAASWRLGDAIAGLRPVARWGAHMPAALVALIGMTLIFGAAQLPVVGAIVSIGAIAYALGTVITARLGRPAGRPAPP